MTWQRQKNLQQSNITKLVEATTGKQLKEILVSNEEVTCLYGHLVFPVFFDPWCLSLQTSLTGITACNTTLWPVGDSEVQARVSFCAWSRKQEQDLSKPPDCLRAFDIPESVAIHLSTDRQSRLAFVFLFLCGHHEGVLAAARCRSLLLGQRWVEFGLISPTFGPNERVPIDVWLIHGAT